MVAQRNTPHRPGLEDFPHPVPRSPKALRQWLTQQATPRWAHNCASRFALHSSRGITGIIAHLDEKFHRIC